MANWQVLGFVGLGQMGGRMARRLVAADYEVVGFDLAGTAERLPAGAQAGESVEDVARRAELVFLSLPDGAASQAVCRGLLETSGRAVHTVVDLSTIGTAAARSCAELLGAGDVVYVDAPVSGGVLGAEQGTLAVMVGAPAALFERVRPLLEVFGKSCFRVGDEPGQGQAMKLLNNYCSATALAATIEAAIFGVRQGLDLIQIVEVINASSGRSSASLDKFPRSIVPGTYDYGFAGALMAKDVRLYLENAEATGTPRELARAVAELWQEFNRACPGRDFTYLHRYLSEGHGG